ncbi:SDR family oxidoreductase [Leptolyngbya sp. FACHB-261]|uniref:SDR family oxidoreductase n=1 Tax=Leptolyngbya sp. FACHB-261 TaxID=2692806 RepID=UPI001688A02E|nr:SDR family oxidoreductase [Leptolyngbya sp. FACHB-261]MBD2102262.1 SDR family oxidoreductase [Leptolyngbya sp. FACHB-261]
MSNSTKVAVVTGANRGLGLETSRQLAKQGIHVVLASRDAAKGQKIAEQLKAEGLDVTPYALEVTRSDSVQELGQWLKQQFGNLDILVNNAGVFLDAGDASVFNAPIDTLRQTMETNVYGPLQLAQALVPLMQAQNYGRIVNVSSGMGQLTDMGGGSLAYRLSKTALNALTRILAAELKGTNILVNSVCPGWVQTDMGGAGAPRTPEQGADTIVWLATLPDGSPSGGFFRDRRPIDW